MRNQYNKKEYKHYYKKYVETFSGGIGDINEKLDPNDYEFFNWATVSLEMGDTLDGDRMGRYYGILDAINN